MSGGGSGSGGLTVPITPPTLPTVEYRSHVAKPIDYDGNANTYDIWKTQCQLYVFSNAKQLDTLEKQILFVISYMKTGRAAQYATAWVITIVGGGTLPVTDMAGFWKIMDDTFQQSDRAMMAQRQVNDLRQGQGSAQDYFVQLEMTLFKAGWTDAKYDEVKLSASLRGLNQPLLNRLYSAAEVPTDWEKFKKRVVEIDNNFRYLRALQTTSSSQLSQNPRQRERQPQQPRLRRDPDAMDVDTLRMNAAVTTPSFPTSRTLNGDRQDHLKAGACFYCHKTGHMKHQCPELLAIGGPRNSPRGAFVPLQRPTSNARSLHSQRSAPPSEDNRSVISDAPPYTSPPRSHVSSVDDEDFCSDQQ